MGDFTGKNVIVTGSTKGIGYAAALRFAKAGASVTVVGRRERECEEAARSLREYGTDILAVSADLSLPEGREKLFAEAEKHFSRIDILVNNVGGGIFTPLFKTTLEQIHAVFAVNFDACYCNTTLAAKNMVRHKTAGRIINIASTAGMTGERNFSIYASAKAAIIQLTRSMALELGSYGITINAVAPGTTHNQNDTNLTDDVIRAMSAVNPLGKLADVDDIASAVLFFAGPGARMITGQTLAVDCGYNTSHYNADAVEENLLRMKEKM